MARTLSVFVCLVLWGALSLPARADDVPSGRDIQEAIEAYLGPAAGDASLIGGALGAGYEDGFWLRGEGFQLRIKLGMQVRYEFFDQDSDIEGEPIPHPRAFATGGSGAIHDLSGFGAPRVVPVFDASAPGNTRVHAAFDFANQGRQNVSPGFFRDPQDPTPDLYVPLQPQTRAFPLLREAWFEWGCSDAANLRMGLIAFPTTRQLMVPWEKQLFSDISMASAVTGILLPGYTDRNRDYGMMLHGRIGPAKRLAYMAAVTNGDGGNATRSVLDTATSDNLALGARVNWAFLQPIGYAEGALEQRMCTWYGEVGAWGFSYADRFDRPHGTYYDRLVGGVDLALGYGGFSFSGAFTWVDFANSDIPALFDEQWMIWLIQAGYHFPGTSWEVAGRWSSYLRRVEGAAPGGGDAEPETNEIGLGVNYYLRGHASKLSFDASFITASADGGVGGGFYDTYAGVPLAWRSDGDSVYIRLQWQLSL